ncbi:MAG: FG-GAP-like repeat-containing protein [Candidatus Woesearchaeota archaeon]
MKKYLLLAMIAIFTLSFVNSNYTVDNSISITGLKYSSQAWGDFNNDGTWDLTICGEDTSAKTIVYEFRKVGNNVNAIKRDFNITNVTRCSINFADINNNGWEDLTIAGLDSNNNPVLEIYMNQNGTSFVKRDDLDLVAVGDTNTLYGDLNQNGFLDLIVIGCSDYNGINICNNPSTRVYINNNGVLEYSSEWSQYLPQVWRGSIALGDYRNNGFLDLAISGTLGNDHVNAITELYVNDGSTFFNDTNISIEGIYWGSLAFGDFNNNGALDLFITGRNSSNTPITKIFESDAYLYSQKNNPLIPSNIRAIITSDNKVQITWDKNNSIIGYNLQAYYYQYNRESNESIATIYSVSPLNPISSNPSQGYFGNLMRNNYSFIHPGKCTYIHVQAIDAGMRKSSWSLPIAINSTSNNIANSSFDENCIGRDAVTLLTAYNRAQQGIGSPVQQEGVVDEQRVIDEDIIETVTEPTIEQTSSASSYEYNITQTIIEQPFENFLQYSRGKPEIRDGITIITERVRNQYNTDVNVQLKIVVPKDFAENTDEIIRLNDDFDVISYNPIIGFNAIIPATSSKTFQYGIKKELTNEEIDRIVTTLIEDEEEILRIKEIIKQMIIETERAVNVTQRYQVRDNTTTFTIDIDINNTATIHNISIFQEIPKCLVEIINEQMIKANRKFEIINVDPVIVWHFDSLVDAQQIQYTIEAIADDDCLDQAQTLAVAKQIIFVKDAESIDYKRLWIAVSIIPLIALIMILFGIITTKIHHDDEKIKRLTDYIRRHYKHGMRKYEIKEKLLNEGYAPHIIDECLNLHTQSRFHYWIHRLEIGFDEFILGTLIVLNLLEFTHTLPGDLDYLKKIISWVLLSYVLFKASISEVLFGQRHKTIDILLILTFFTFTFKNIIAFAKVSHEHTTFVTDLYYYLIYNNIIFERYLFITGIILLLLMSFYIALRVNIKSPSFLASLHVKEGLPHGPIKILGKVLVIHLTLLVFFVLVFNLMMEWLAIAVDALIIVITLIIMVFVLIKHHKKMTFGKFMEETSESAENFYEKFIRLFHYKKTIYLGISGMLILHAFTEIGTFIVPYFTGIQNPIYFGDFGENHLPLFSFTETSLFYLQTAAFSIITKISVGFVYIMNIIAIIMLFTIPGFVWYNYFKHRALPIIDVAKFRITQNHTINSILFGIFCSSIFMFIMKPVFRFRSLLGGDGLAGVDILTQNISFYMLDEIIIAAFAILIITFLISFFFEKIINLVMLPTTFTFFAYYIYLFSTSILNYNITQFGILIRDNLLIAAYSFIFGLIAMIILYLFGFVINSYLYTPHWIKEIIQKTPIIKKLFDKHGFHHIHYYELHDDEKHTTKEEVLEKYILKSLDSGHELFYVVEHLREHNWPAEIIENAIDIAKHDKLYADEVKHIRHYHHNMEKIEKLAKWIERVYPQHTMKDIIDLSLKNNWTEDDVIIAFKQIKNKIRIRNEDKEVMKYMYIVKD